MSARAPGVPQDTDALTTLRAARLIVFGIVLLDSTDVFVGPAGAGRTTGDLVMDLAQDGAGLVAAGALLWGRGALASTALVVLAGLGLWRGQLVGIELVVLLIGVGTGVATAGRRALPGVLVASAAGVGLIWLATEDATAGLAAAVLAAVGLVVGLVLRSLLAAQRTATSWAAAEAEARSQVRAQLAADLRAIVDDHLSATEAALRSLRPDAAAVELRRVLAVSAADSRAALASLRELLSVLEVALADERGVPSSQAAPPPWTHRLPLQLRSAHVRLAGCIVAGLLAVQAVMVTSGEPLQDVAAAAVWVAAGLAVWRPRSGAAVAAAALLLASATGASTAEWLGIGLLWLVLGWTPGRTLAWLAVLPTSASLAASLLRADDVVLEVVTGVAAATAGALIGLALGHYCRVVDAATERRRALSEEPALIQQRERRWVARELHDVVGHELSRVSLRALSVEGVDDAAELRAAIDGIGATVRSTREALASLLGTLADPRVEATAPGSWTSPSATVAAMAEELRAAGHRVDAVPDPAVDAVDATVQRTLERILQEATTNMLRHAPSGARCTIEVRRHDEQVLLECSNPVGEGKLDHSSGRGLRGIQERAAWVGGHAHGGVADDGRTWALRASLPVRAEVRAPAAPRGRPGWSLRPQRQG